MDRLLNDDITLCLRRASDWKIVKKTGTYEASVSDYVQKRVRVGLGVRDVNVPTNTRKFAFTKAELDEKDPRIAETLDTLNAHFSGPKRRQLMARCLRFSYYIWHQPIIFTKDNVENYVSRVLFAGLDFKNKDDFFCIFEHIKALHSPTKPLELSPGVFAKNSFTIAAPEKDKTKLLLSTTDILQKNPGLKERLHAALSLELDKYELSKFVLKVEANDNKPSLPEDFMDDIEISF